MRESLLKTQDEVPFNNFTGILRGAGVGFPPELGGDCVVQARQLVDRLREKGVGASYLEAVDKKHIAVVASCGEELFYLDPLLYQDEPSSLTAAFKKGVASVVRARPMVNSHPSKVTVAGTSSQAFDVSAASLWREVGFYSSFWGSRFSLGKKFDELPVGYREPTAVPPSTFLLRVLNGKGEVLEIRRPAYAKEKFSVGRMEGIRYAETSAEELSGNAEAEAIVLEIARLIGVEASVILDKMAEATRVCMKRQAMRTEGVR
ncbi:MAG: hypothetical protein Q7R86_02115 [bacterium]|nr:hypothetical protein [bacterium]